MAIGEAGSITTNSPEENTPINITFDEPLTDPIIVMTGTNNGGNAYNLRVIDIQTDSNGDATGFTFIMEEWEYLDGPHRATETLNFLAIEKGVHTLPDGRVIEAGTTSATSANSTVSLTGAFTDPPVVMTSVMSNNDMTSVDSDAWNISDSGFTVALEEEEGQSNADGAETVGFIAVEGGFGAVVAGGLNEQTDIVDLGGTFITPISVADTQTRNEDDPGNVVIQGGNDSTNIGLWFQEEQSGDRERVHLDEDVGVITFEDGVILCFTSGTLIETPFGMRDVADLRRGDLVLTADAGPQPVQIKAETTADTTHPDLAPITIRANAIAPSVPQMDLTVSPQHRILVKGWRAQMFFGSPELLVPAKGLINDCTIIRAPQPQTRYIHIGFDAHHIITSNGLATESLHAGHVSKSGISDAARNELFTLFPDLRTAPSAWAPTVRPTVTAREARVLS